MTNPGSPEIQPHQPVEVVQMTQQQRETAAALRNLPDIVKTPSEPRRGTVRTYGRSALPDAFAEVPNHPPYEGLPTAAANVLSDELAALAITRKELPITAELPRATLRDKADRLLTSFRDRMQAFRRGGEKVIQVGSRAAAAAACGVLVASALFAVTREVEEGQQFAAPFAPEISPNTTTTIPEVGPIEIEAEVPDTETAVAPELVSHTEEAPASTTTTTAAEPQPVVSEIEAQPRPVLEEDDEPDAPPTTTPPPVEEEPPAEEEPPIEEPPEEEPTPEEPPEEEPPIEPPVTTPTTGTELPIQQ